MDLKSVLSMGGRLEGLDSVEALFSRIYFGKGHKHKPRRGSFFLNCVRLTGIGGQIEDKVLLFYNYKTFSRLFLLPFFWLFRWVLDSKYKIQYLEIFSVGLAILTFPDEITGLGLLRVIFWCGPLYIMRDYFGLFGKRGFLFNLFSLSLVNPLIFEREASLLMLAILMSIHGFVLERSHWMRFLSGNIIVSFWIGIGQKKVVFFDVLMSPIIEIIGYVYNLLRYIKLNPEFIFEGLLLDQLLCRSEKINVYLETNAFISNYMIKIFVSFFLLGYLGAKGFKKSPR